MRRERPERWPPWPCPCPWLWPCRPMGPPCLRRWRRPFPPEGFLGPWFMWSRLSRPSAGSLVVRLWCFPASSSSRPGFQLGNCLRAGGRPENPISIRPLSAWSSCARKACTGACGVWRTTVVDVTGREKDAQVQNEKGVPANRDARPGESRPDPLCTAQPCRCYRMQLTRRKSRRCTGMACAKPSVARPPQFRIPGRRRTAFHRRARPCSVTAGRHSRNRSRQKKGRPSPGAQRAVTPKP